MRVTFFWVAGIALLIKAFFDDKIGIDEGWGRGRFFILITGLVCIFAALLIHLLEKRFEGLKNNISDFVNEHINRTTQFVIVFFITTSAVIISYIWFAQPAVRTLQNSYNYYSEQAIAFKAGNLFVAEEPSINLLSLSNPYDYFLRKEHNIEDFPWDVSLYKGKFYLYWGPAPAVLLTLLGQKLLSQIGDHHITLTFACGLFLYAMLIITTHWNTHPQRAPIWITCVFLLTFGFATPITIMLQDSRIYEASILGCQFFFIGGCYWVYSAINNNQPVLWKLVLGSIHWALAAGTRVTIAPVILFTVFTTLLYIYRTSRNIELRSYLKSAAALGIPLLLAALGLGWYNWARFDSIFEFGITYQLTNVDYNLFKSSFSKSYMQGNLYNYLLYPFKLLNKFPYISRIEYLPSNERMAGLIFLSPYVLLVTVPLFRFIKNFIRGKTSFPEQKKMEFSENWLIGIFASSTVIAMTLILSFYFVTMRYLADFMPSLLLLTTIQLGREFRQQNRTDISRQVLSGILITLSLLTIMANILVAVPQSAVIYASNLMNFVSKLVGLK